MSSNRVEFRLNDDDLALLSRIAKRLGLSIGLAARQFTVDGARAAEGIEQPKADLLAAFHHDLEEFRAALESLNDSAVGGLESVRRDVGSIDILLVALLRGILQLVAMGRMFGEAQDKALVERALRSADQSVEVMLQKRRDTAPVHSTETRA